MTRRYRSKNSYVSQDFEKRQRQLSNLKQGRKRQIKRTRIAIKAKDLQEIDIITFATDPKFLGLSFKERPAQEVLLRVLYGLPLDKKQLKIYKKLTGNKKEFEAGIEKTEAVWVLGARAGKSLLASIITLFEATHNQWNKYLNKGESGYIVIIATRQKQAEQIIQANCSRLIENSPGLRGLIKDLYQTELSLNNGMKIISLPCNSTAGRGLPIAAFILDEVGHFYTEGVKADETIYNSLRPRMAQFPGAKVISISTPAAKQGLLWDFFQEGFQVPGRFTTQAATRVVNPEISQEFIDNEYKRDPDYAKREFGAEFAEKTENYFSFDLLKGCFTLAGSLPYKQEFAYNAGIDQSGLSGRDRFALAISHREDSKILVDYATAWDTKDSDFILKEIEKLVSDYKIYKTQIDKYAKGWVAQALNKLGLEVEIRPNLAEIYSNLKSLMIAGKLNLPESPELRKALLNTQAYYGRNNNLSIAHQRSASGHGDLADAIATSVYITSKVEDTGELLCSVNINDLTPKEKEEIRKEERELREDNDYWNEVGNFNLF